MLTERPAISSKPWLNIFGDWLELVPCSIRKNHEGDESVGRRRLSDDGRSALAVAHIAQQAIQFLFNHGIAFARVGLKSCPIKHHNVATSVTDKTVIPQFPGGLGHAFSAHTERAGDLFLRHNQLA